ncbi:MAG: hypothetical protein P4L93_09850 [Coriobacteriia bacterium]|nr:hypothetical protein [Coriobacteriia bacterium]
MGGTTAAEGLRLLGPYLVGAAIALCLALVFAALQRDRIGRWLSELTEQGTPDAGAIALAVLCSLGILAFFAGIELIATALFFAGRGIVPSIVLAASVLAAGLMALGVRRLVKRGRITQVFALTVVTCVLVSTFGLFAASRLYDVSWDGQWIHQPAAVVLANGWNPVSDPMAATVKVGQWRPDLKGAVWTIGIQNFAKGMWIRTGAIYAFTRHIEMSKAGNLVLLFVQFVVWFALALRLAPRRWWTALLVGTLAAVNPIVHVQLFTYKNDGQLGSLFTIALGLGCLALAGEGGWPTVLGASLALLMLCTIKFTGLVYAAVLVVGLVAGLVVMRRFRQHQVLVAALALTVLIAVGFVGYNPYVFNTQHYGSPFYPLVGRGAVDTLTDQSPRDFAQIGNGERLFRSLFSKAEDERLLGNTPVSTELKVPFTLYASELRPYLGFDTRVAGFGPLFSGALVLAVVLLGLLLFEYYRARSRTLAVGMLVIGVLLVSVAANPAAWWARYTPQIWLIPVVVAALALLEWRSGVRAYLAYALCFVLVANAAIVGTINFANVVHGTSEMSAALERARTWPGGVLLKTGDFETSWTKLNERGVRWRLVGSQFSGRGGLTVPYSTMTLYPRSQGGSSQGGSKASP